MRHKPYTNDVGSRRATSTELGVCAGKAGRRRPTSSDVEHDPRSSGFGVRVPDGALHGPFRSPRHGRPDTNRTHWFGQRRIQRFEDWSGFPLRWFTRRVFYAACIAAWAGVAMALLVTVAHHEGGVRTEIVCSVHACTPGK